MVMAENYHALDLDKIYDVLQTNPKEGLSEQEVNRRLEEYGPNELPKVSRGFIKIYLAPLFNWLIVIYLIGALILLIAGFFEEDSNFTMIALTLGIVFLNCIIAVFQQYRATKKLKALKELTAPTTTVIRDGQKQEIATTSVVVGDVLALNQGDRIPADSRIVASANLEVNEASLTGESEPVKKVEKGEPVDEEAVIHQQTNMVFYGTYITTGNGTAIAVKTGGDTEIGKISQGLEDAGTSEIPIRKKMNNFGKYLGLAVLLFWFVILMIIYIASGFTRLEVVKSLNSAMDIMPINIPLLSTIILLTGVLAMAHHGVIVRNLASVDSLGRVSVVCSDKTGTLTRNQMSIQNVWVNGSTFKVSGSGYEPEGDIILMDDPKAPVYVKHIDDFQQLKLLLTAGFLNNNSAIVRAEHETKKGDTFSKWDVIGSPTEGALMVLFQKGMGDYSLDDFESVKEFPFDSRVKRMSKVYIKEGNYYSFTKGASEILIPLCSKVIFNNQELDFTEDLKQQVMNNVNEFAGHGYRILSLSYKKLGQSLPNVEDDREFCESQMIYVGFVTILDPPRDGVKESVEECHKAGVEVVMITGDSPTTAKAIAEQISIVRSADDLACEGKDIDKIQSMEEFKRIKVFARVSPEHKQDIIKNYKSLNRVVAMTGDGVNDALALNMADAGVAMGIQGTDVAKEAADMVISDDSFNSIVVGIRQGRGIFAKIRAVVFFYICINLFEGVVQFILAVILGYPYFLDPEFYWQWIFLSLTLHTFPGLALTFDTISDDVMDEAPRDSEEILAKNTMVLLMVFGGLLALSMVITYFIVFTGVYPVFPANYEFGAWNEAYLYTKDTEHLSQGVSRVHAKTLTMMMATLFFCETFLVFQIRRPNKNVFKSFKEDINYFAFLLIGILVAVFMIIMYVPGVQVGLAGPKGEGVNFMFMYLTALDWLVCFLISLICILGFEAFKYAARTKGIRF